MRRGDKWEEETHEEYSFYLETLDPDYIPMDYDEFVAMKIKDEEYELAAMHGY